MMNKLTKKQKKFCNEYMKTGNITQSAINAGYSKDTAYSIGSENLKKPEIILYLKEKQNDEELDIKKEILKRQKTLTDVLEKLLKGDESLGDVRDEVRYNLAVKYSEQLNKMQGAYIETPDNTINNTNITIINDL